MVKRAGPEGTPDLFSDLDPAAAPPRPASRDGADDADRVTIPVLVPLPLGLGLGYLVVREYRPVVERIQLGLERVLDQLEHGRRTDRSLPPPPRLIDMLANEVRKALSN